MKPPVDQQAAVEEIAEERAYVDALTLFGDDAATAIAYCGIDAWFDGKENETRQWGRIYRRLRN
jgi:hypothetical protein